MEKCDAKERLKELGDGTEVLYTLVYEMQALINICEQAGYSQVEVGEGEKWAGVFGIMERLAKTAEDTLDQMDEAIREIKRSAAI